MVLHSFQDMPLKRMSAARCTSPLQAEPFNPVLGRSYVPSFKQGRTCVHLAHGVRESEPLLGMSQLVCSSPTPTQALPAFQLTCPLTGSKDHLTTTSNIPTSPPRLMQLSCQDAPALCPHPSQSPSPSQDAHRGKVAWAGHRDLLHSDIFGVSQVFSVYSCSSNVQFCSVSPQARGTSNGSSLLVPCERAEAFFQERVSRMLRDS